MRRTSELNVRWYPIYHVAGIALEQASSSGAFLDRNTMEQVGADRHIEFTAVEDRGRLLFELACCHFHAREEEEIWLYFDPGHSGRRPHNARRIRLVSDREWTADEFSYEWVPSPHTDGIRVDERRDGEAVRFRVTVPLAFASGRPDRPQWIKFNAIRMVKGEDVKWFAKWSGLPGEKSRLGQGCGTLLLTAGMDGETIARNHRRIAEEDRRYGSLWVRRAYPPELDRRVKRKRRAFTVNITAGDAQRARYRAEHTAWGRLLRDGILEVADYWKAKSDEDLFELIPAVNPRAMFAGRYYGDPLTGGNQTTFEVCLERPYHFYNRETGEWWYPGKTFLHPQTGDMCVLDDDGTGFVAPEGFPVPGSRFMFTAAYRLFVLSMLISGPHCPVLTDRAVCPETTGTKYAGALINLAYAHVLTGDIAYARKAWILIGRIAEIFPYLNGSQGDGSRWECAHFAEVTTTDTYWLGAFFEAADLVFGSLDAVADDLRELFGRYPDPDGHARTRPFSAMDAVDGMIPHVMYGCEVEKVRDNDWALRCIQLEIAMACFMENGAWLEQLLYDHSHSLASKVRNGFYRDGRFAYDTFMYNDIMVEQLMVLGYCGTGMRAGANGKNEANGVHLLDDAVVGLDRSFRMYFRHKPGKLTPMFGDNHYLEHEADAGRAACGRIPYSAAAEIAFARSPLLRPMIGPLMAAYDEAEIERFRTEELANTFKFPKYFMLLAAAPDAAEYAAHRGAREAARPWLFEDSQISVLRAGAHASTMKHAVLYGAPTGSHAMGDKLGLWIGAYGYQLLSGAGGYPFNWVSPKLHGWEKHTAATTALVADGRMQRPSWSRVIGHYEGERMQLSEMDNVEAYPGSKLERRIALISAPDGDNAYLIDLCAFEGEAAVVDYSTHALRVGWEAIEFDGIGTDWQVMRGTLAGEDVPLYSRPGHGWMKALRTAPAAAPFRWTFRYGGANLRFHAFPDGEREQLICCEGELGGNGMEMGKSRWEPFVLWRKPGGTCTRFAAVLEPYRERGWIGRIAPLHAASPDDARGGDAFAWEIEPGEGWTDIVVVAGSDAKARGVHDMNDMRAVCTVRTLQGHTIESDARFALFRFHRGRLARVEAYRYTTIDVDGERWTAAEPGWRGVVERTDLERQRIDVRLSGHAPATPALVRGAVALIDSPEYAKPSAYYVLRPEMIEERLLRFETQIPLVLMDTNASTPKRFGIGTKSEARVSGRDVLADVKPGDAFIVWNSLCVRK